MLMKEERIFQKSNVCCKRDGQMILKVQHGMFAKKGVN